MSLMAWSWAFLTVYLGAMIVLGVVGQRRVRGADDFAVARDIAVSLFSLLLTGVGAFALLHSGILDPSWFEEIGLSGVVSWLDGEAPNPFSCAALAQIASVIVTVAVSLVTPPLPREHLAELFAGDAP